jgi:DNA transformation protein
MAVDEGFVEHLVDLLAGLGGIRTRRMFGAVGFYSYDQFFAVADEDALYLNADALTRAEFEAAGSKPFSFEKKDGSVIDTSFWSLPESALDDPDEAVRWGRLALEAARRKAEARRKRRPRPS